LETYSISPPIDDVITGIAKFISEGTFEIIFPMQSATQEWVLTISQNGVNKKIKRAKVIPASKTK
jgi:hypothetical protein